MEPDRLFDIPGAPSPAERQRESPDARRTRRRTRRRNEMLAAGIHPRTRLPTVADNPADPDARACGNCAHHFERHLATRHHKCDYGYGPGTYPNGDHAPARAFVSHGPATDVRVNWPACVAWEPEPEPDAGDAP